jgi:uncharacterized integral membrane protein
MTSNRLRRGTQLRLVGAAIALAILILFIAFNFDEVTVDLLVTSASVRLGFALIFTALLGFLAGYIMPKRH